MPQAKHPGQKHTFSFDRVFGPSASQEAVFDQVSEFVQSSLDGYNVTIFSYGQTVSRSTSVHAGGILAKQKILI